MRDAIDLALDGEAILFCGAGFAHGATAVNGQAVYNGATLAASLGDACGLGTEAGLEDAAEAFLEDFGSTKLIDVLEGGCKCGKLSAHHKVLGQVPWKRIYTTNYDNIMEMARAESGLKTRPVTLNDRIESVRTNNLCVHLNGYIEQLSTDTLGGQFKLTGSSYLSEALSASPWLERFQQDLAAARVIIVIGYSLYDLDIARVFNRSEDAKRRCWFIDKNPAPALDRKLRRFGQIYVEGVESFASEVSRRQSEHTPIPRRKPMLVGFNRIDYAGVDPKPPTDSCVRDLLVLGDIDKAMLLDAVVRPAEQKYLFPRSALHEMLAAFGDGTRTALVHASLGNGKTLLVEALACSMANQGFATYRLRKPVEQCGRELEAICSDEKPHLIVVENYPSFTAVLKEIRHRRTEQTRVLLTARTQVNDVAFERMQEALGGVDILEIDLNKLDAQETTGLIDYLNRYGLWGRDAAKGNDAKAKLVATRGGDLVGVLVSVIASEQIREKFREEIDKLREDKKHYEALLALCIAKVLDLYLGPFEVANVLDSDVINQASFQRAPAIKEFVRGRNDGIQLKSSVLARMVLQDFAESETIEDIVIGMARRGSRLRARGNIYYELVRLLMMYSNLASVFPERNRRSSLVRFYEAIKDQENAARNAFFWLQYAIARLAFNEYDLANRYFETAYSFARNNPGFKTFQLDTQYARYLIESVISEGKVEGAMAAFRKAHQILAKQSRTTEHKHYPFRIAGQYWDFWRAFRSELPEADRAYLKRAAEEILRAMRALPDRLAGSRHVIECKGNLDQLLASE